MDKHKNLICQFLFIKKIVFFIYKRFFKGLKFRDGKRQQ